MDLPTLHLCSTTLRLNVPALPHVVLAQHVIYQVAIHVLAAATLVPLVNIPLDIMEHVPVTVLV